MYVGVPSVSISFPSTMACAKVFSPSFLSSFLLRFMVTCLRYFAEPVPPVAWCLTCGFIMDPVPLALMSIKYMSPGWMSMTSLGPMGMTPWYAWKARFLTLVPRHSPMTMFLSLSMCSPIPCMVLDLR